MTRPNSSRESSLVGVILVVLGSIILATALFGWSMTAMSTLLAALVLVCVIGCAYAESRPRSTLEFILKHAGPYIVTFAGIGVFFVPIVIQGSATRANTNWDPPLFGPGDTSRYTFDEELDAVQQRWSGSGRASAHLDGEDQAVELETKSRKQDWEETIGGVSDRGYVPVSPWIEVTFPSDEALADMDLTVELTLEVEYPKAEGRGFRVAKRKLGVREDVALSGVGQAGRMRWTWAFFCVLASALIAAGEKWLSYRIANEASGDSLPSS